MVRLLAYSSIAQAGYFLMALVALGRSGLAAEALVVFAAAYAAMNLGAFAVVARVGCTLRDMEGLARISPGLAGALLVFLLSLVGVPPLAGFFGKLLLLAAAIDADYTWLAVVGILNTVLSLAMYMRIVVPVFRLPSTTPDVRRVSMSSVATIFLVLTVVPRPGSGGLVVTLMPQRRVSPREPVQRSSTRRSS